MGFTEDLIGNCISFGICLAYSLFLMVQLYRSRNISVISGMSPVVLSALLGAFVLNIAVFTFCCVLNATWRQFMYWHIHTVALLFSLTFLMIIQYYRNYAKTDRMIVMAASILKEHQTDIDTSKLVIVNWTDKILDSPFYITLWCVIAFVATVIPFVIFTETTFPSFFKSRMDNIVVTPLMVMTAMGIICTAAPCIFMGWVMMQMQKKGRVVPTKGIISYINVFFTWVILMLFIMWSSGLGNIAVKTYDFRPLLVGHVSFFVYLCYVHKLFNDQMKRWMTDRWDTRTERSRLDKSFTERSPKTESGGSVKGLATHKEELLCVLKDHEGFKRMLEAARKEFCVETVLFFAALSDWETLALDDSMRTAQADEICKVFCLKNSSAMINISHKSRAEIEIAYKNKEYPPEVFELAKKEILHMIQCQTYVKFRANPLNAELLAQIGVA